MVDSAIDDFIWQMYLLTLEESPLHEVPKGSVDHLPSGPVTHGPWSAQACSAVLHAWHAEGLLELFFRDPPAGWGIGHAAWHDDTGLDGTLATPHAEALISSPERWIIDDADGHVQLCRSQAGQDAPWESWYALAHPVATTYLS